MMKLHATLALVLTVFTVSTTSSGTVRAQADEIISDLEAYAVYASVVPTRFSTGDKPLTALVL